MASVLTLIPRRKGRYSPTDPHEFESIGDILRRLRGDAEAQMTATFSWPLSLKIDYLLDAEQRHEEDRP
jgi:hypothetical protein